MIDAVKSLARSRKALLLFVGALINLVVHFVPDLKPIQGDFLTALDAGIGLVIVMIGVEDAAEKHGPGAASADDGGQG